MEEIIFCRECGKELHFITGTHLKTHGLTIDEYKAKYPTAPIVTHFVSKKIRESKIGTKRPDMVGKNNPAKRTNVKKKIGLATSKALKGRTNPNHSKFMKEHLKTEKGRKAALDGLREARKSSQTESAIKKLSESCRISTTKYWKEIDEETKKKRMQPLIESRFHRQKPNGLERRIISLIKRYKFPFEYVGDGTIIIEQKCPDFMDTLDNHLLIEVLGCYWHGCPDHYPDKKRWENLCHKLSVYNDNGFEVLWIWEHETDEIVKEKISNFCKEHGIRYHVKSDTGGVK